jgi:uncharacterized protein involved in tellurium resistance
MNECNASEIIKCSYNFGNDILNVKVEKKYKDVSKKHIHNGLLYEYKIENINDFNKLSGYISITNPRGHKISYPLNCFRKHVVL